jgi:FAD:protein FMN transferase
MTMTMKPTRRRALCILGAAAGLGAAPWLAGAASATPARPELYRWRGSALGAVAEIAIYHEDRAAAEAIIADAVAEVERGERLFSLYREDSALSQLNRAGRLDAPPLELVALLAECRQWSETTGGAFDTTVQPLWRLYAEHFATADADPAGPVAQAIAEARSRVDWRAVRVTPGEITFRQAGMAVTLNGIAQGAITDRVAERLRDGGIERVLIDLGEARALGGHPDGAPWRIGLEDPQISGTVAATVGLEQGALATSAGGATRFTPDGRHHHLFDPASGRSAGVVTSVSVTAPRATTADALSTALAVMTPSRARPLVASLDGVGARLTSTNGSVETLGAWPGSV